MPDYPYRFILSPYGEIKFTFHGADRGVATADTLRVNNVDYVRMYCHFNLKPGSPPSVDIDWRYTYLTRADDSFKDATPGASKKIREFVATSAAKLFKDDDLLAQANLKEIESHLERVRKEKNELSLKLSRLNDRVIELEDQAAENVPFCLKQSDQYRKPCKRPQGHKGEHEDFGG